MNIATAVAVSMNITTNIITNTIMNITMNITTTIMTTAMTNIAIAMMTTADAAIPAHAMAEKTATKSSAILL